MATMTMTTTTTTLTAPAPMLASALTQDLRGAAFDACYGDGNWIAERKFDGHRVEIVKQGAVVVAWSRPRANGSVCARALPENITAAARELPDGIYDGELCALGIDSKSWQVSRLDTAKVFVVFDVLALLGQSVLHLPLTARRELLEVAVAHVSLPGVQLAEQMTPTWSAVEALWKAGAEGIILKRKTSTYRPGYRSPDWRKVKAVESHTVTIIGFEAGSFGPHATIKVRFDDGAESKVKTKNNGWLKLFAADAASYIGKRLVIECQLRLENGAPRHPMAKAFAVDHLAGEGE